jgi:predicted RNase H-like HicB family nuclease
MKKKYNATATREGKWWIVHVPEIDQVTQGRSIKEAEYMARDLIAAYEDVPEDSFTMAFIVEQPDEVSVKIAEANRLEQIGRDTISQAAKIRRDAARALKTKHQLSAIDVAAMLGVTRTRAYQLTR